MGVGEGGGEGDDEDDGRSVVGEEVYLLSANFCTVTRSLQFTGRR